MRKAEIKNRHLFWGPTKIIDILSLKKENSKMSLILLTACYRVGKAVTDALGKANTELLLLNNVLSNCFIIYLHFSSR